MIGSQLRDSGKAFFLKEPNMAGISSFLSISLLLPTWKVDIMPGAGEAML